jgi:hypothetical protein
MAKHLFGNILFPMKLSDLERIERDKELKIQREQIRLGKKLLAGKLHPELPAVRSTGLVVAMTEDERKAMFEKMRKESGL